jgi:nucleoside-diphosphate-sugar epimerase
MRIFITGATGYIGWAVASAFARAGHQVHGLARSAEKARRLAAAEITPVMGSMEDPASFTPLAATCEVMIHCAAEYSPRQFELDARTVSSLIESAPFGVPRKIIYTSGVWIYGDTAGTIVDESSPSNPPPLVAPRVDVEQRVLSADKHRIQTLVIRPGCVYGGSGGLTGAWFESAVKDGAARVIGDGNCRWAMVHVADLAELYLRAADSLFGGEVFNATDRSRFTVNECAVAASRAAGSGGKAEHVPVAEARKTMGAFADCFTLDQHVDSSKAVRLLGWQPRHGGFVDGAERYFLAWKALREA